MWSIRVDVFCVTLAGDCIICLNTKVRQISNYFLVSGKILFVFYLWLCSYFFSVNTVQFLGMPLFGSSSI